MPLMLRPDQSSPLLQSQQTGHADPFCLLSSNCCLLGPVCLPSGGSYADNARHASTANPTLQDSCQRLYLYKAEERGLEHIPSSLLINHIADNVLIQIREHARQRLYNISMLSTRQPLCLRGLGTGLSCRSLLGRVLAAVAGAPAVWTCFRAS